MQPEDSGDAVLDGTFGAAPVANDTAAPAALAETPSGLAEYPTQAVAEHEGYAAQLAVVAAIETPPPAAEAYGCEPQPQPHLAVIDNMLQPATEPGSHNGDQMQEEVDPCSQAAFDDMVYIFLNERRCTSIQVAYTSLKDETQRFLRSLKKQRLAR